MLFTGRHLLPNREGHPIPLKTPKTFHWKRQLRSVVQLLETFSSETLRYIMPGAMTGRLRGDKYIAEAYDKLASLKMDAL